MDRRKALAIAGSVTGTLTAATLAAAANFGLLGFGEQSGTQVGTLKAANVAEVVDQTTTTTTPEPETEIVYDDVVAPAGTATTESDADDDHGDDAQAQQPAVQAPASGPTAVTGDDHDSDDSVDSADHAEEDHEPEHDAVEHEGAEDDD